MEIIIINKTATNMKQINIIDTENKLKQLYMGHTHKQEIKMKYSRKTTTSFSKKSNKHNWKTNYLFLEVL